MSGFQSGVLTHNEIKANPVTSTKIDWKGALVLCMRRAYKASWQKNASDPSSFWKPFGTGTCGHSVEQSRVMTAREWKEGSFALRWRFAYGWDHWGCEIWHNSMCTAVCTLGRNRDLRIHRNLRNVLCMNSNDVTGEVNLVLKRVIIMTEYTFFQQLHGWADANHEIKTDRRPRFKNEPFFRERLYFLGTRRMTDVSESYPFASTTDHWLPGEIIRAAIGRSHS